MGSRLTRSRRCVAGLAAAAIWSAVAACGGSSSAVATRYRLQGQILSVAPERREAVIKHEAIAGFMEAMTMPYYVRDVKEIAGLKPGDLITSTLVIESGNGVYLKDVTKVGEAPLERRSPGSSSGIDLLGGGAAAPDASFVDQDGKPREFASFRGQTVVLTFVYTACPLPTFCPLMDRNFAAVQSKLAADEGLKNVHLVTVSIDPANDTPAVLKRHAATLKADPARWTFLTGEPAAVEQFAARFGVSVMREANAADLTHNLRTAIIDATGTVVQIYTGNDWTPEQLLGDLAAAGSSH